MEKYPLEKDVLLECTSIAIIAAPIEKINLSEWLFTLKDHEYKACSPAHIAAGSTISAEGKRMSVNVEQIADNLLVQHYVESISQREHCRVHSISDSFSAFGTTKLGVVWDLKIKKLADCNTELSNRIMVFLTDEFVALLKHANITDLATLKDNMEKNAKAHNKEETPFFAKDIEIKALTGIWL